VLSLTVRAFRGRTLNPANLAGCLARFSVCNGYSLTIPANLAGFLARIESVMSQKSRPLDLISGSTSCTDFPDQSEIRKTFEVVQGCAVWNLHCSAILDGGGYLSIDQPFPSRTFCLTQDIQNFIFQFGQCRGRGAIKFQYQIRIAPSNLQWRFFRSSSVYSAWSPYRNSPRHAVSINPSGFQSTAPTIGLSLPSERGSETDCSMTSIAFSMSFRLSNFTIIIPSKLTDRHKIFWQTRFLKTHKTLSGIYSWILTFCPLSSDSRPPTAGP